MLHGYRCKMQDDPSCYTYPDSGLKGYKMQDDSYATVY